MSVSLLCSLEVRIIMRMLFAAGFLLHQHQMHAVCHSESSSCRQLSRHDVTRLQPEVGINCVQLLCSNHDAVSKSRVVE